MEYMITTGYTDDVPLAMINKARILGDGMFHRYEEAIELAREAMNIADSININAYVVMAHQEMHDNYLVLGDFEQAYIHFAAHAHYLVQQQSALLRLHTDMQQYELQLMQTEAEVAFGRKTLRITMVMGGALLFISLVFLLVLGNKNREKRGLLGELNSQSILISKQNKDLMSANLSKDRLFSIIGHDLRTPFQGILGYSELLKDNVDSYHKTDIQKFATRIHQAAEDSLLLLSNLLHWAKIQRKQIRHEPAAIELKMLAEEIVRFGNQMVEDKDITLENNIPTGMKVFADLEMLKTILRNLIDNAIKFTKDKGRIELSAQTSANEVIIAVKDNGLGIREDVAKKLFCADDVSPGLGTSNEVGTGLGLTLCREFVEIHGGRIWVESTEGKGSKFFFSIPGK